MGKNKNCKLCGKLFLSSLKGNRYCSKECRLKNDKRIKKEEYIRHRELYRKRAKQAHLRTHPKRKKWFADNFMHIEPSRRWHDADGYAMLHFTKGINYQEHRWFISKKLGRLLKPWETVHHINRIKDDNRLDNLELRPEQGHYPKYDTLMKYVFELEDKIKKYEKIIKPIGRVF